MKQKKRIAKRVDFDTALADLMVVGMGGLVVAGREDAPQEAHETEADQDTAQPKAGLLPFDVPILPPPLNDAPTARDCFV